MLKKITVLAMALGALAAFGLPSTASADWRHGNGLPIQSDVDLQVTGTNVNFQSALGGIGCQTISTVTFFVNQTTGEVDSFTPHPTSDTANCSGTGGLAFCQVHNLNPTGLPWQIHTITEGPLNKIQITVKEIHSQVTGGFCPIQSITLTGGNVTADPEQEPVETLKLHGELQAHLQSGVNPPETTQVKVGGQLHVLGAAKGTYRI